MLCVCVVSLFFCCTGDCRGSRLTTGEDVLGASLARSGVLDLFLICELVLTGFLNLDLLTGDREMDLRRLAGGGDLESRLLMNGSGDLRRGDNGRLGGLLGGILLYGGGLLDLLNRRRLSEGVRDLIRRAIGGGLRERPGRQAPPGGRGT